MVVKTQLTPTFSSRLAFKYIIYTVPLYGHTVGLDTVTSVSLQVNIKGSSSLCVHLPRPAGVLVLSA